MNINSFLIKKFLKSKNKFFFTFENILSVLGIFIGVFSIIIVSSVMNGFDRDITNRILSSKPEIIIRRNDFKYLNNSDNLFNSIKHNKNIKACAKVSESELIVIKENNFTPVKCLAIEPKKFSKILNLKKYFIIGSTDDFNQDSAVIGLDLSLQLHATVGEKILISDIKATQPTPLGLMPRRKSIKIVGIFKTGLPELDRQTIFVPLNFFRTFIPEHGIDYLQIKSNNNTKKAKKFLSNTLSLKYRVEDWKAMNKNIFLAIKIEKVVMMFVLFLMIIIATFNMSGFLIKFIQSKNYELAILQTMGISKKMLKRILSEYVLILGLIGSLSASVLALAILILQSKFHIIQIPVPGLPITYLPVSINFKEVLIVFVAALIVSYLSLLYPVKKMENISIVEILRDKEK